MSSPIKPHARAGSPRRRRTLSGRRLRTVPAAACAALAASMVLVAGPAHAADPSTLPPGLDPGTPTFTGSPNPVPDEPVAYDPTRNMLRRIFDADQAAGGDSYWVDRMLARPFSDEAGETTLLTRGRALYMYTHDPGVLGFASEGPGFGAGGHGNGWAYRQPLEGSTQHDLYTVSVSGEPLAERTDQRMQYPSHFSSAFTRPGLRVAEKKFITYDNVAVTNLTLTNTADAAATVTLTASSPIAATPSGDGSELTGEVTTRYAITTVFPRFSGDGFTVDGTSLARTVTLDPGQSTSVKLQLGVITRELPQSAAEYQRYRGYDPDTAWRTQMKEYNEFWVDNVPYVDIPDKNVEKISYYRTWENRFNSFDGNVPGNDYQFPVGLEGALGYNNQISLTVPMRMQDLKFYRDPLYSYGPWLSEGEESGCQAFHDNPGNTGNWNNTYEQWTAEEAWKSYLVHGGPKSVLKNLAKYSECDVKGTLAKFDTNGNDLIEYTSGTLPGNDADSVAFKYYGTGSDGREDRTESSYWYSGAKAAASEYEVLGEHAKANEMEQIADRIKSSVMNNLWADGQVTNAPVNEGDCDATGPRVPGELGNAVKLCGTAEYIDLPDGITSGLNDFTVSTWVNPASNRAWSRVFDFGTGTSDNMFLTVSAGGGPLRFAITTGGSGGEQQLNADSTLPEDTWSHVAVTLSGNTGTLYVNGEAVATNDNMTLRPSDLGDTDRNWIGRSQYGDPNLNATVDDFQVYDHALTADEVAALAGGQQGAGNVVSYRFDEDGGATAVDSSGNGLDATIVSEQKPTITCPGKAFLQRHMPTDNLVCWKDQQNFTPFIDGIPPNTPKYKQALRYYADKDEFGIFPVYTANQADQAEDAACGPCDHGSNNFSNINFTLQARLYSKAIRDYPSPYITPEMYAKMIEWQAWNYYVDGDNRFPDNNEFFFDWDPEDQTLGRSWIHHDVLGSFNWMFFEDVAGVQARLDDMLELYPIDMGYDHFTVNNLSYHGSNLTVVWQQPGGKRYYQNAPYGYSAYLDGHRVLTVDRLAHLTWNSHSGRVRVLGHGHAHVRFQARGDLKKATDVSLRDNARMVDAFQKAGRDLSGDPGSTANLAEGKDATASFTTTDPESRATSPANAVDGFTISGLPVRSGSYVGTDPIWGDEGSPNDQDWLAVDLGKPTRLNDVKLYFYSNKEFGRGEGGTYREPVAYTIQYLDGDQWVDVPGQVKTPESPLPNYNRVDFPPLVASQLRVLMTRQPGLGVGVKEVQAFDLESVGGQVDSVRAYVDGLQVHGGARLALKLELRLAEHLYDHGKQHAAVRVMRAFGHHVNALSRAGELTAGQAAYLLASERAIIAHIRE